MRPVARIAQSVEQGIENPRVLGSIPSPGTTIQKNPPMAGFLLLSLSHRPARPDPRVKKILIFFALRPGK